MARVAVRRRPVRRRPVRGRPVRGRPVRGKRPDLVVPALLCGALLAYPGTAVIIDSGDGTGNTTAPVDDPGFAHVGTRGGLTVVYLGDGWVLTANHVGVGRVKIAGTTADPVPGTDLRLDDGDGTWTDLLMFAVHPPPPLPLLPVRADPLVGGEPVVMAGNGRDRGPATSWDPNGPPPPGPVSGYEWAASRSLRWGTNTVHGFPGAPVSGTVSFQTSFDAGTTAHEAQAANGDSGGAVFAHDGAEWQLAGIMFAIAPFEGQPAQTALYGNLTYAADLSFYAEQIEEVVALPEPGSTPGLGLGGLLLAALRRRIARPAAHRPRAGAARCVGARAGRGADRTTTAPSPA